MSAEGAQRTLYFFSSSTIRWKLLDLSKSSVLRSISAMADLGKAPTPYGENRMSMVAAAEVNSDRGERVNKYGHPHQRETSKEGDPVKLE